MPLPALGLSPLMSGRKFPPDVRFIRQVRRKIAKKTRAFPHWAACGISFLYHVGHSSADGCPGTFQAEWTRHYEEHLGSYRPRGRVAVGEIGSDCGCGDAE